MTIPTRLPLERGGLAARPMRSTQPIATQAVAVGSLPRALELPQITRWVVAAAIFLSVSKFQGFFPILATIRAPLLLSATAFIMLLGTTAAWRPSELLSHWIPRVIGLIVVIAILGIPFGIYPGQSFRFFNEAYSRTVVLSVMVWASARTQGGVRFMTKTIAASCLGAAFLAFVLGRTDSSGRLAGGFAYDPNDIALIAVIAIPLFIWWAIEERGLLRWLLLLTLPLFLHLIIKTQSRGGFLGLLAVTAGFLLLGFGGLHPAVRKASITVGLLVGLSIPFFPASYLDQMRTITAEDDYNRTSPRGRKQVWERGMGYAKANPFLGVGIGNFGTAEGRLAEVGQDRAARNIGWKWGAAHNSFVQVAAEMGLIAGSAYVILILGSITALIRFHRKDRHRKSPALLPPFLALSLVGFTVSGFFLSWGYYDLPYAMIALTVSILTLSFTGNNTVQPGSQHVLRTRGIQLRG